MDGIPSKAPNDPVSSLVGEDIGDVREGEETSKYPSFAEILKKNLHLYLPLTRRRKSNRKK
jgi:hypothetical protein